MTGQQQDRTLDPGRRLTYPFRDHAAVTAFGFDPGTLREGRWADDPEDVTRLFADLIGDVIGAAMVGGFRPGDRPGWAVAVAFLVDGNAEACAPGRSAAVDLLREQLADLAGQGVTIAHPGPLYGDPFKRPLVAVTMRDTPRPQPAPDPGVLARLNVPASPAVWHALCDEWGVPRNPDALVRAVKAATWDRATTAYLADRRAREDA